jgi:hypothetical protein
VLAAQGTASVQRAAGGEDDDSDREQGAAVVDKAMCVVLRADG